MERIPVSEVEQVEIELDRHRTTDGALPDPDGIICWERDLAPGATDETELAYELEKRSGVAERS